MKSPLACSFWPTSADASFHSLLAWLPELALSGMRGSVPIRAISLDLDDTLWPVTPTIVEAERTLREWLAVHAPRTAESMTIEARKVIRDALLATYPDRAHDVSYLRREAIRIALAQADEDPALAEPAFDVFLEARQRVAPYDDVVPVLARWSLRYSIVAVSNGNADVARVGLGAYFHSAVSAHEIGIAKPDPRIFAHASDRLGVPAAQTLHIGDDLDVDVRAARQAGMRAAWIRRPDLTPPEHPARAGGHGEPHVFDSLTAIDAYLRDQDERIG